jgi:hypothetical protein
MAATSNTVTLNFEVKGDNKVMVAMTNIEKMHGKLVKTISNYNSAMELMATKTTITNDKLTKQHALLSKHQAIMANLVKFWIAWNVAQTVWNATAAKAIGFMTSSIAVASRMNEAYNLIKVTFGDMIKKVDEWASHSSAAILQTRNQAETQLAQLQMLFQGVGIERQKAFEMSKVMVERAADIGSLRNIEPAQAFEGVRRGLLNQPRLLRGMGVPITGVVGQADIQTKTLEMYNRILEKTAIDQGDVVRTADQWENIMRAILAHWTDLKQAIGNIAVQHEGLRNSLEMLSITIRMVTDQIAAGTGEWGRWADAAAAAINWFNRVMMAQGIRGAESHFKQVAEETYWTPGVNPKTADWINQWGAGARTPEQYLQYRNKGGTPIPALEPAFNEWLTATTSYDYIAHGGQVGPKAPAPKLPGMKTINQPGGGGGGGGKLPKTRIGDYLAASWASFRGGGDIAMRAAGLKPARPSAWSLMGAAGTSGWGALGGAAQQIMGSAAGIAPDFAITPWHYGMEGAWGQVGADPLQAVRMQQALEAAGMSAGAGISARARGLHGRGGPSYWDRISGQFGASQGAQVLSAGLSGGLGGALTSAGSIAGGAFGPIGSLLGGLLGGGIGRLFGKKKQDVGLSPANPIYTRDVGVMEVLSQLLNVTKGQLIGGTGAGIDRMAGQLRLQGARA